MSTLTKMISFLLVVCLSVCGLCLAAAAESEEIDFSRLCNLSIVMRDEEKPICGGDLTLFRVGEFEGNGSTVHYVLTEQFADSGVDLTASDLVPAVQPLADYAESHNYEGTTYEVGDDGMAHCKDLAVGLYLVIQKNPAEGYYPVKPFLVHLPALYDGHYLYDYKALPKVAPEKVETSDDSSESSESSDDSSDISVPQTGQLQWPIPILFTVGFVLIVLGLMLIISLRHRRSS